MVGDVLDQWLMLGDVCEVQMRDKKNLYLALLVRLMPVCGERYCGI